jgi:glycosyltransferase involved in cell wall biosynthesis/peptidoglycan/xylan/chitin deacetylase (PgdA/CDA1 family)
MKTTARNKSILMILENESFPEDTRVNLEATALHEAGYNVIVISPKDKQHSFYEMIRGVHVYRYPKPLELSTVIGYIIEYGYSMTMALVLAIWVWIRHGFDAIHIHCPPDMNILVALLFKVFGKRCVVDLHDLSPELLAAKRNKPLSSFLGKGLLFFERLACRTADSLIATNLTQQRIQIQRGGAKRRNCYVVRNGPNEQFSPHVPTVPGLKSPDAVLVGFIGSIGVQDTVENFVYALADICKRRNDIQGVIVGGGPNLENLKKLAKSLELDRQLLFTGPVPFATAPSHIATFDICVTPDISNPYNDSCTTIKTMEYMAIARPTVAFDTTENRYTAGAAALYASSNSVHEFARLIEQLADDPKLRADMGKIGRKRIDDLFSWNHQKSTLIRLYDELFGLRPHQSDNLNDHPQTMLDYKSTSSISSKTSAMLSIQFIDNGVPLAKLQASVQHDIDNAVLSKAHQYFYKLRPLIPSSMRRLLQRIRNRNIETPNAWYEVPEMIELFASYEAKSIWPDQAEYSLVLTHDVETLEGMRLAPKIAALETALGLRSSWNIVPYKYKIDQGIIRELRQQGHEIGIHGYNHDGRLFMSKEIFDSRVPAIQRAIEEYGAVGFRAPMVHRNLHWMQVLNIDYDASCFDVDPYQAMPGGVGSLWPFLVGKFVELPYTLPQDHTLFLSLNHTTDQVWRDKLSTIRRYHGMALMLTHPDYLASPKLKDLYYRFLVHTKESGTPWHVLPREMAKWFRENLESTRTPDFPSLIESP